MRGSGLLSKGVGALGLSFCPWAHVRPFPWAQREFLPWALVGPFPTERSEACSERSDEVRDCKVYITPTKACT